MARGRRGQKKRTVKASPSMFSLTVQSDNGWKLFVVIFGKGRNFIGVNAELHNGVKVGFEPKPPAKAVAHVAFLEVFEAFLDISECEERLAQVPIALSVPIKAVPISNARVSQNLGIGEKSIATLVVGNKGGLTRLDVLDVLAGGEVHCTMLVLLGLLFKRFT